MHSPVCTPFPIIGNSWKEERSLAQSFSVPFRKLTIIRYVWSGVPGTLQQVWLETPHPGTGIKVVWEGLLSAIKHHSSTISHIHLNGFNSSRYNIFIFLDLLYLLVSNLDRKIYLFNWVVSQVIVNTGFLKGCQKTDIFS